MRLVLMTMVIAVSSALAGTWMMAPGKGSHASAGAPAGNAWTLVNTAINAGIGGSSGTVPAGSVGDIVVAYVKWEGTGSVLSSLTEGFGATVTLRGSQNSHGSVDLYGRFATYVATSALASGLTPTFTGSASFIDMMVWRLSVSGTVTYTNVVNGTGTGTSTSSGAFTTATQNGIVLAALSIYGNPTVSSMLVGGNTPNNTYNLDVGRTWDYKHSAQLSSAAATATLGTSFEWNLSAFSLTAQ